MKARLFTALIALAFAVFSVAVAYGMGRSNLQMEIFGGNHISSDDGGFPTPSIGPLTAIQSGKSKGSRHPDFFSTATLDAVGPYTDCDPLFGVGAPVAVTLVFIYDDGSLLSLTTNPSSYYCFDPFAGEFFYELAGTVEGGNGRYEGSSGTWDGKTSTFSGGRFTGEISVNLD